MTAGNFKHTYLVQLQHGRSGQVEEVKYVVGWDPEKVSAEEVARACAAERQVAGGKIQGEWKHPYIGLTAVLQDA
jgi:hypothetical protein